MGVNPPHTPSDGRVSSANSRHSSRTGHAAQISLAGPASASATGKNTAVSAELQAASSKKSVGAKTGLVRGMTGCSTPYPPPSFPYPAGKSIEQVGLLRSDHLVQRLES